MRKCIIAFFICLVTVVQAQDPHRHDTIPFGQWRQEIVKAPVLTGRSQPIIIVPNREQYCFDKQLNLKMSVGRRMSEQCTYIDTHNGLTGILPPSSRGGAPTEILPELENFNFTVMGMKGNIYTYKNQKGKQDIIEHWVFTGNTQSFQYQSPTRSNPGNADLVRKSESRTYCDGRITAQAYRYDGGTTTWYVYGDRYPAKLHPQKYLGPFGVGYMYTTEGLYLIMELNFGSSYVRIGSMENVHNCFDPSGFRVMEDAFVTKQQEEVQREKAKADEEQAHISGDCTAEKQAILDFKKNMNQKHEELVRNSQHGNLYQDATAQKAMMNMMDPLSNIRLSILNAKLGICGAQTDMAKNPGHAAADGEKIRCLNDQIVKLQDAESGMTALDNQYASQPARANAEKSKMYWELLKNMPRCD